MRSPSGKPSSEPEVKISTPDSGLLFSLADGITLPFLGAVFHLGAGLNLNQFGASMAHAGLPVRQGLRHRDCPYFSKNTYLNACFFCAKLDIRMGFALFPALQGVASKGTPTTDNRYSGNLPTKRSTSPFSATMRSASATCLRRWCGGES